MTQKEAIDKLLDKLSDAPDDSKLRKTIPDGVEVLGHEETGYNCVIDFSKEYYDMTPAEEVLMRSAVVRTITQLDSVMYISFTVESALLPLHIAIIYILKLCLDEEIIPRCRFPCSSGYFIKYINWQKKQSFSISQSYCKRLIKQQKGEKAYGI